MTPERDAVSDVLAGVVDASATPVPDAFDRWVREQVECRDCTPHDDAPRVVEFTIDELLTEG